MERHARDLPETVEPLRTDPDCSCLICRTAYGDRRAAVALIDRLVEVVVTARRDSPSDSELVEKMRRRFRRSSLAPTLVGSVLSGAIHIADEASDECRVPPATQWIREWLDDGDRLDLLEAIVDVLAELPKP